MFIFEWKGVLGWMETKHGLIVPLKTLKRWHRCYLPIPFDKTAPSHTGRIFVHETVLESWYQIFLESFPYLYNVRRRRSVK